MGWHLCTFQWPFVALRKYLTCISTIFKGRLRDRGRQEESKVNDRNYLENVKVYVLHICMNSK